MRLNCRRWLLILVFLLPAPLHSGEPLPGTAPLSLPGDDASVARRHIKQATDYFRRKLAASAVLRDESWKPDFSAPRAYATWLAPRRAACRKMLGLGSAKTAAGEARSTILAETGGCRVERFTIPVSNRPESAGLLARGLLFSPITKGPHPLLVVCGDATQWPEQMSGLLKGAKPAPWLVKLLGRGAMVYLPQSVERLKDHPYCKTTNHKDRRQILYRLGYVVGRTMTGLDVEDTLAAIEYFAHRADVDAGRIGLVGMGQGGMTALYTAALDRRVQATAVADYFQTHAQLCDEPVDRRLPGQFLEFGDAEVAALVAPRLLFVVHSNESSEHDGPVAIESRRAARFYKGLGASGRFVVVSSVGGEKMLKKSVELVSEGMGLPKAVEKVTLPGKPISKSDAKAQRDRHFAQKLRYLRFLIEASEEKRQRRWNLAACPVSEFDKVKAAMLADYRKLVGKVDTEGRPLRPRTDLVLITDTYKAYRVVIDVA
ncbi:MAG: dienelactone hydrolase family protein, partial [Planctomycetota bacterium]|nr:dienelactone hydrolase family protein [Planctomycetota bacterium]